LQSSYPRTPSALQINLNFINTVPCALNISFAPQLNLSHEIYPGENYNFVQIPAFNYSVTINPMKDCNLHGIPLQANAFNLYLKEGKAYSILIILDSSTEKLKMFIPEGDDDLEKSKTSNSKLRYLFN